MSVKLRRHTTHYAFKHTLLCRKCLYTCFNMSEPIQHCNNELPFSNLCTSTWHIDVLALLWLVAHLNGQVGWVSLHLLSPLLLPCWWLLPFWTCFDTVPSPCMEGGSGPASQEGLGQLRGAAQLTTSQLSSAPLQSLVHHKPLDYVSSHTRRP